MRRIFVTVLALCVISTVSVLWLDALKKVATEVIAKPPTVALQSWPLSAVRKLLLRLRVYQIERAVS